jgi:hypothetical protein
MTMRMMTGRAALGLAIVAMSLACSKPADAPAKVPLGKAPEAAAPAGASGPVLTAAAKKALDSGNVLFRAGSAAKKKNDAAGAKKQYADALLQYRQAAKDSPDHAAPWFGIQMVAKEQNNTSLADSAFAAIRARNAAPAATGAQHDMSDSTLNKLRTKMKGAPPIG